MVTEAIQEALVRDLNKLKEEIGLYKNDESVWAVAPGITNSAGNLCLHLTGNISHFIGAILGGSGYVRNRDNEFALKDIPRKELIDKIESAIAAVKNALGKLNDAALDKDYPGEFFIKNSKTGFVLVHLVSHFNYHLGQVNYHRRLLTS